MYELKVMWIITKDQIQFQKFYIFEITQTTSSGKWIMKWHILHLMDGFKVTLSKGTKIQKQHNSAVPLLSNTQQNSAETHLANSTQYLKDENQM